MGQSLAVPDWAESRFQECLDHLDELREVLHLSVAGITTLTGTADLVEALVRSGRGTQRTQADIEHARAEAARAQKEVDNEFPILHAQAVLLIWATLEHLMVSLSAEMLRSTAPADLPPAIARLRVRAGELLSFDDIERSHFLLAALEHELTSPLKQGVNRFESLLEVFGLSGPVPPAIRDALFELQQVRNVHAHRRGSADSTLLKACPWLGLRLGDQVGVSHLDVRRYFAAATGYVTVLVHRFHSRDSGEEDAELADLIQRLSSQAGRRPEPQLPLLPSE